MVEKLDPKRFQHLMAKAQMEATQRFAVYRHLAGLTIPRTMAMRARPRRRTKK